MHKKLLLPLFVLLVAVPALGQTTFRCESVDGRYRECRADGFGNLIVARQLSDANCVQGRTWGYRDGVIWVDQGCRADFQFTPIDPLNTLVMCESVDGKLNRCPADTFNGVRLARQVSDSACRFGRDWGYDNNGIWVTNGCRAEFGVRTATARPAHAITLTAADLVPTIRCESINNTRSTCDADTRSGITLVRQLSENPCVLNRTWGVDRNGIWVTDGCRGDFAVAQVAQPMTSSAREIIVAPAPVLITQAPVAPVTATAPTIVCESINNARSHCRTDTSMGVTLLRQMSDSGCVRDRTWGVDRNGIWVTGGCRAEFALGTTASTEVVMPAPAPASAVFVCESIDGRRSHCPVDTSMGVNLMRQISDSPCVLNQSWGVDEHGIWVNNGCRAEFTLGNARIHLSDAPSSSRVLCESVDGQRKVCPADTRLGVAVVRQISDSPCRLNSTWGFDANGIWVTAGCRAEFVLRR